MMKATLFPFVAITGQEKVKRAILIALVNPKVGGLLISGEKGSAKSTLVRSAVEFLPDSSDLLTLPLNAGEEMIFGTVDLEKAMIHGQKKFLPGLITRANGKIIYIDEINLLRQELLTAVLDTNSSGINRVEREGISYSERVSYTVIGTMNPEEGTLPKPVLDRFGLFVETEHLTEMQERVEVIKNLLCYSQNVEEFCRLYQEETLHMTEKINSARKMLIEVEISEAMVILAAQYSAKAFCEGHRAELFLLEAASAIAALAGRTYVLPGDLEEAAFFVLPHRMRQLQQPEKQQAPPEEQSEQEEPPKEDPNDKENDLEEPSSNNEQLPSEDTPKEQETSENLEDDNNEPNHQDNKDESKENDSSAAEEKTADIDYNFYMPKMLLALGKDRKIRRGSGKRSTTRTDLKQGRYVRSAQAKGEVSDLAFDATIRAAAPYQKIRSHEWCSINITKDDLRNKVREKRIGNTFIFLVDASGSMGARERMRAVKGAIFQMLQEAYQKRDRVGMIAFRRQQAEVLLPVTRSIDLAQKCLQQMPTGGKTPLSAGLQEALALLSTLNKKDKDTEAILIVVTDGRANAVTENDTDPVETALKMADKFNNIRVTSLVIDTESSYIKLGVARKIAQRMGANYYTLSKLSKEQILRIVRNN
ncbi:MAG TPA: VWA domain-containing protein [Candidatus Avacidaminococcus intestinavium]|uniref:VWA domain-containing protein n=1 Tax=Candidatus Avacidaminococcus intestinavium TaxID=2840684 RepID=A0A9D1MNJ1_9FIRM|nr:VWA domain-containing protein [Candidatus Avacidaminococcus intestinavium]